MNLLHDESGANTNTLKNESSTNPNCTEQIMERELADLNDLKEQSRLRLANLKRKCSFLKTTICKYRSKFPVNDEEIFAKIIECEREVRTIE